MTIIEKRTVAPAAKKWVAPLLLVIAMVATAGWVASGVFQEAGANAGYVVGYTTTTSLIVWAALYFGFSRRSGWRVGLIYFSVIFATGLASGMFVSSYEAMQAKSAVRGISHSYNAVLNGESIDPKVHAEGDVGQVESWVKNFLAIQMKDHQAYESELDGAGVSNLLLPENLKADGGLVQAKAAIVRGRKIVEKYHALYNSRIVEAYTALDKSNMNPSLKAQTKEGLNEGMANSKALSERVWALEAEVIEEMGAVVNLLADNPGGWTITDTVAFRNADVLATYNAHVARLQKMAKEEQALKAQAQTASREKLAHLESLTR